MNVASILKENNDSHSNFWVQIFQRFVRPWPNSCRISVLQLHRWWSISFHPSYMLAGVTCLHYICTFNPFNQTIWKLYEILMDVLQQLCPDLQVIYPLDDTLLCTDLQAIYPLDDVVLAVSVWRIFALFTSHYNSKVASSSFIFSWAIVALV